ncbi:hypothetical protein [Streptomyces sp. NPDC006638]|uniref:hypothetical protein n=1 Tax=Streptomyces sp. NPDC006638 TaxID=3157183 RepID=UPI0033B784FC
MSDEYDTCAYCGWAGKLRKDGTMRKHRERADSGRLGVTGSLPQDPNGPVCKGSGMEPWKVGLPEDYEVPPTNGHGGFEREREALPTLEDIELPSDEADREQARREAAEETNGPTLDDYAQASRIIQSLIPGVRR